MIVSYYHYFYVTHTHTYSKIAIPYLFQLPYIPAESYWNFGLNNEERRGRVAGCPRIAETKRLCRENAAISKGRQRNAADYRSQSQDQCWAQKVGRIVLCHTIVISLQGNIIQGLQLNCLYINLIIKRRSKHCLYSY